MIGPNQVWRRREPVGNDVWDEIRILGTFEDELTVTSNVGFTEVVSAIAESILDHYVQVGPEVDADPEVATPRPTAAPWETSIAELARG